MAVFPNVGACLPICWLSCSIINTLYSLTLVKVGCVRNDATSAGINLVLSFKLLNMQCIELEI